jgi:hypothetical protein
MNAPASLPQFIALRWQAESLIAAGFQVPIPELFFGLEETPR